MGVVAKGLGRALAFKVLIGLVRGGGTMLKPPFNLDRDGDSLDIPPRRRRRRGRAQGESWHPARGGKVEVGARVRGTCEECTR